MKFLFTFFQKIIFLFWFEQNFVFFTFQKIQQLKYFRKIFNLKHSNKKLIKVKPSSIYYLSYNQIKNFLIIFFWTLISKQNLLEIILFLKNYWMLVKSINVYDSSMNHAYYKLCLLSIARGERKKLSRLSHTHSLWAKR